MKRLFIFYLLIISLFFGNFVNAQQLKLKVEVTQTILINRQKTVFFKTLEVLSGELKYIKIQIEFSDEYASKHPFEMGDKYQLTFITSKEEKEVNRLYVLEDEDIKIKTSTNWFLESIVFSIDYSTIVYKSIEEALKTPEHVYQLNLSGMGLTDLPKSLAKLVKLERLSVYNNNFSQIPEVIQSFSNLKHLTIHGNHITVVIPKWLWDLRDLESLTLAKNPITNIPEGIHNLTMLNYLSFSKCNLTSLPNDITQLSNLEEFDIHGNKINELPQGVEGWAAMKKLHLGNAFYGGNNFSLISSQLGLLKNLEVLSLSNNPIEDVPLDIITLPNLKMIWLDKSFDKEKILNYKKLNPKITVMQM